MEVTKVTASLKGWMPTQVGGGISLEVSYEASLGEGESEVAATKTLIAQLRAELVQALTPIAKSRAKTIEQSMKTLPKEDREKILAGFGPSIWLEAVMPELAFGKPDDGFDDLDALKQASELLDGMK